MRPTRPTIEIAGQRWSVQITDDQSRTLIDPTTGVAFHSASGGFSETSHVYLQNSGIRSRIETGQPSRVLEVGLGFGMAMLATVDLALQHPSPLRYTAIECDWLDAKVLRQLDLGRWLQQPQLAETYIEWRDSIDLNSGETEFERSFGPDQVAVVHHVNALDWQPEHGETFNAIYFDPFAPAVNPELWTTEFFERLRSVLEPGGRLVTYCVNRAVRESLTAAGFEPKRVRGPKGGKREVMIATPVNSF